MQQLKIAGLVFGSLHRLGGYQVFTCNLMSELAARGHDVTVYMPLEVRQSGNTFHDRLPFKVKPLPFWYPSAVRRASWLAGHHFQMLCGRRGYDLCQVVGAYPAAYVASWLKSKMPTVLRSHGDDIQVDRSLGYGQRLDESIEPRIRRACQSMTSVVAMTEDMAECYRSLDVCEDRIIKIPNGVDLERLSGDRPATTSTRIRLLTVGRYHPKKGFLTIPKIARHLADQNTCFEWNVVGRGMEPLQEAARKAGVGDFIHCVGEIGPDSDERIALRLPPDGLVDVYRSSDVFVFPSLIEGFPRVVIEAMAAGLPVVTTDAPGCRDVVEDGETGLLFDPEDGEGMARGIMSLTENKDLRCRLVENALTYCRKFDWSVVVDQYESLYVSLIENHA